MSSSGRWIGKGEMAAEEVWWWDGFVGCCLCLCCKLEELLRGREWVLVGV